MIVEKGPYKGLRFAKRTIVPRDGNARMRCGTCGGMDFEVHVAPEPNGSARVDDLVCLGCTKHRRITSTGHLENTGTLGMTDESYISPLPTEIRAQEIKHGQD